MATSQVEAALRQLNLGPVTPSTSPNPAGNEASAPRILIDQVGTTATIHSIATANFRSTDANEEEVNMNTQTVPSYVFSASPPQLHQRITGGETSYCHENGNVIGGLVSSSSMAKGYRRDSTLDSTSGAESDHGLGLGLGIRRSLTFFEQHEDVLVQSPIVSSTHGGAQPPYESGTYPSSSAVSRVRVLDLFLH
jgi:hypothetical protein